MAAMRAARKAPLAWSPCSRSGAPGEYAVLYEVDQPFEHLRLAGEMAVQRRFAHVQLARQGGGGDAISSAMGSPRPEPCPIPERGKSAAAHGIPPVGARQHRRLFHLQKAAGLPARSVSGAANGHHRACGRGVFTALSTRLTAARATTSRGRDTCTGCASRPRSMPAGCVEVQPSMLSQILRSTRAAWVGRSCCVRLPG